MAYDYTVKQAKFVEKAKKFGLQVKFNYEIPTSTVTEWVIYEEGSKQATPNQSVGGNVIRAQQKTKTVMLSGGSTFKPSIGGTMQDGNDLYRIVAVEELAPGGVVVIYKLGVST